MVNDGINPTDATIEAKLKGLAVEIATDFQKRIGNLNLTPEEIGLVQRASEVVAEASLASLIVGEADKKLLDIRRDAALATLQNITVGKQLTAEQAMRESVLSAIAKGIKIALGLAVAAITA
jgi:hypothetical protein